MKTISTLAILIFSVIFAANAQQSKTLPSVSIKTLDGKTVSTSTLDNDGKPIILSFWASWCRPCIKELSAIADLYEDWKDETGVKLIAISIDDARTLNNVRPMVNARGWEYEFYLDANSDLRRAMGVTNVPHTFILNGKKEVVFQHTNYTEGSEYKLFEEIKSLVK
ncbi:MAG TPA: TlpA disulfide reductase family protein [Tenuifilaceae bacterium]|nr:TlpA disulfide reductase family protein [Tenuifilaceae bacterium]